MKAPTGDGDTPSWRTEASIYRDIANVIEQEILDGKWKPGDRIPPEPELMKRFGASRGTLRMAIAELAKKGFLFRKPGRGTFVLGPELETITRFFRFERSDAVKPIVPETRLLGTSTVLADADVAAALQLPLRTKVPLVHRLRSYGGQPFLIVDSYFTPEAWSKISKADFESWPLYDILKEKYGFYIISADKFLSPALATADDAVLLGVSEGSAVIRIERISYSFESEPVEYRRAVGRGDNFRYHVHLR